MNKQMLFAGLPEDIQARLYSTLREHSFKPGEAIFHQDTPAAAIYVVVSGRVKIVRVTQDGYESILCVRQPGEYFCPVPVLDGGNQLGMAVAMTDVTLLEVESGELKVVCRLCPQLLSMIQGDCLAEVRHLLNRLETFAFRSIKGRLAAALLDAVRYQRIGESPAIGVRMTHQELAALVGASRESVSRTLAGLKQARIVELQRGKVLILDLERLKQLAGHD